MTLISVHCFLFALAVILLYFVLPKKWQWLVLVAGNLYFYISFGLQYLFYLLFDALISYGAALAFDRMNQTAVKAMEGMDAAGKEEARRQLLKRKKKLSALAIVAILFFWILIKYGNFFLSNLQSVLLFFSAPWRPGTLELILPLGMSFYTFHAIGYLIDVYRKKYPAEKNFLKYFCFVSFFPHMIEGPFSRFDDLGRSLLQQHSFSYERFCQGMARILWGVFKKVVIADPLASTITIILSQYQDYGGIHIVFSLILYSIRLYADFSGYMDIVCGFCRILGISLAENFARPYFAQSVEEYWRRWHITLGRWFRDYVFFPASMSRAGTRLSKWARKKWGAKMGKLIAGYFALIFVWTATGLWHGASWTYLVWGYLNLVVIVISMQLADFYARCRKKLSISDSNRLWKGFRILRTYFLVSLFRFFGIAPSLSAAFSILKHGITDFRLGAVTNTSGFFVGMFREEILFMGIGVIFLLVTDILQETGKWDKFKEKSPIPLRALVYSVMLLLIVLMSKGADVSQGFMYANF